MRLFNTSPWVVLVILLGLLIVPLLVGGGFVFRNQPLGMQTEFAIDGKAFKTVDAQLKLGGQDVAIHGVVRCHFNPYPGLSEQDDFSFPDGFVQDVTPNRQVTLVVRGICAEAEPEKARLHLTVIDRTGDEASVYLSDAPQLAGSEIKISATNAADWARPLAGFVDNCDEDGFVNTGRIGVWHLPGDTFVGDLVSPLGIDPRSTRVENVSNYIDNSIGDRTITTMLRDWNVKMLARDINRACADNETYIGKGCLAQVKTRLSAYALASIDGGTLPTIRIHDGALQLGPKGVVHAKRMIGEGYTHNLRLTLSSGERYFYVQRLDYCYAPVWRYDGK